MFARTCFTAVASTGVGVGRVIARLFTRLFARLFTRLFARLLPRLLTRLFRSVDRDSNNGHTGGDDAVGRVLKHGANKSRSQRWALVEFSGCQKQLPIRGNATKLGVVCRKRLT